AVRTASPPGTAVWLRLDDEALRVGAGGRSSDIPYSTFQSVRAGRHAVLVKLRGASAITAVPRALLTDDDIALLRSRIG
ncbi:YcxB family protein, partial [Halomonas sp. SIMBA_159]